jgi:hypothetical protein
MSCLDITYNIISRRDNVFIQHDTFRKTVKDKIYLIKIIPFFLKRRIISLKLTALFQMKNTLCCASCIYLWKKTNNMGGSKRFKQRLVLKLKIMKELKCSLKEYLVFANKCMHISTDSYNATVKTTSVIICNEDENRCAF